MVYAPSGTNAVYWPPALVVTELEGVLLLVNRRLAAGGPAGKLPALRASLWMTGVRSESGGMAVVTVAPGRGRPPVASRIGPETIHEPSFRLGAGLGVGKVVGKGCPIGWHAA